jgi:protocatechuate 4,5-dioxygenase, alpha chain
MDRSEAYADIPGTYLFDKRACAKGYHVNNFCMSLMKEENRKKFLSDPATYLNQYPLTEAQRRAILERDWLGIIKEGGNIYYVSKLGATCGLTFEDLAASMSGMKKEDYRKMMLSGGRPIAGNRSKAENQDSVKEEKR